MKSAPSFDLRRQSKRKHKARARHKTKHRQQRRIRQVPRTPVPTGQSWFGTLSLTLGLIGLFILCINGMLYYQSQQGTPGVMRFAIVWSSRLELLLAIAGLTLALLSFPFSSARQRNAVFGFLCAVSILGTWIYAENWRYLM